MKLGWEFPAVTVIATEAEITSTFHDGKTATLSLAWASQDAEYAKIANWAGYDSARQYAIEHELTHHWFAEWLKWPYSFSLHDAEPYWPGDKMHPLHAWEEHIVNGLQRYAHTGQTDGEGVLYAVFRSANALQCEVGRLQQLWKRPTL